MRVFVTGATGALGRHLVPALVAAGHEVTATTRALSKAGWWREVGAEPVAVDGMDREAVTAAVTAAVLAAAPEVIVHEMTALAGMRSVRHPDKLFAATNELRTRGTDNLLAAAAEAGTRRVIAQSHAGAVPDERPGPVKTEEDPPEWRSIRSATFGYARAGGVLRMPRIPVELAGQEEIGAGSERRQDQWEFFVQNTHPGTIQLDGDTATGRAYMHELARTRDGRQGLNYAIYHDRYQRTPDGWKFTERVYEVRYLDTSPLAGSAPRPARAPAGLPTGTVPPANDDDNSSRRNSRPRTP